MEKGATLTLTLPCNTNKKLPMLLERNENGGEFNLICQREQRHKIAIGCLRSAFYVPFYVNFMECRNSVIMYVRV